MVAEGANAARESLKRIRMRSLRARQVRARTIRAQISFARTLCAMGERGFRSADIDVAKHARHSINSIRDCLDWPGCVPASELSELRTQLEELEPRIQGIIEDSSRNRQDQIA